MAELTQEQNEALVRLMLAGRYEDKKLSLIEGSAFEVLLERLDWQSGTSRSIFAQQATAAVRKALADPAAKGQFLQQQCAVFRDSVARDAAIRMIEDILTSDGGGGGESAFVELVRREMGA